MRRPTRHRPQVGAFSAPPATIVLADVAERARYVGSPEHKDTPSFAGQPRPRADAAICPRELFDRQEDVTGWLKGAIRKGAVGGPWEGVFPRYVWHKEGSIVYLARLVNRELGEYKGWPLNQDEWPGGIERYYG
ncbi:MAG: hypothetical protein AABZ80_03645 [Gemmatimonadota bacterium]